MFEAAEVKHPHAPVCAAADKDIDTLGTEADVEDFFVVSNELGLCGKRGDVPDCTSRVDAGCDDEAG